VAYWNRRTQDGTWDKNDRKDAANCADLLEQGKVLFYSQPTGALAELRHLVRCLRRARAELARCKARWRTTLRPMLAPSAEPLPLRVHAALPRSCRRGSARPQRGAPAGRPACRWGWPRPAPISAPR
jgi:transposase